MSFAASDPEPLAPIQPPDEKIELSWPRGLFKMGHDVVQLATCPIELAGPPRCLFFGPYILVPAGEWTATIGMAFSADAAGNALMAEVYCGSVIASSEFNPRNPGFLAISLDFHVTDPNIPLEIRAFSLRSCLEGRFSLGGVILDKRR